MDIRNIKVYAPSSDGFTYQTLLDNASRKIDNKNFLLGIVEKQLASVIDGNGTTLDDFLHDTESGFFSYMEGGCPCVVFVDGEYHLTYNQRGHPTENELERISNESGYIVTTYCDNRELENWAACQDFYYAIGQVRE